MKVLQFGRFWHDQHGGIERHVALLSKELATLGVDVINIVASQNLRGSDTQIDGYRLIQVPSFGVVFSTAIAPGLLIKALALHREKKFDILHLHLPDPLSHLVSMVMPRNIKRVITWHSDIVKQKRILTFYRPFLHRLARQADALVAATPAHFETSTQIPKNISWERRHVIPYGLDYSPLVLNPRTAVLRDALRARAQGRGLVFALGRQVYYKGFDVLIDALQHTDAFLILGGDGPLRPQLEQQAAARGVSNRVYFSGRIPEEELAAYFNACDVFCLPSVEPSEAFGLVQLEAMACGKPVVCTQLNNGVNVVNVDGHTGFAVPVRDPLALGCCLARLLNDDALRKQMGGQALINTQNYSVPNMVSSNLKLYQDLLSTSR